MNASELSLVTSVLAGLILGAKASRPLGPLSMILGALGGLLVGLAFYFIAVGISVVLVKIGHSMDDPPKNRLLFIAWWIANFAAVMIIVLAPIGTMAILSWVGALLKK